MAASCGFFCSGPRMGPSSRPRRCHHGRSLLPWYYPYASGSLHLQFQQTLDLFDGGGLHGTVMIFAQADAQLGIEEEKLHVFFVPAHSATSHTALRAVQLSMMFVWSGAHIDQQKFSTSAQHSWYLIQLTLRTRTPLCQLMSDSWDKCVPEFLSGVHCLHEVME